MTMATTIKDRHLLSQLRRGDAAALQALAEKYGPPLYQTALAITRNPRAAEDIRQQCFVQLHAEAGRLEGEAALAPWLYRTTIDLSRARLAGPTGEAGEAGIDKLLDRFDRLMAPGPWLAARDWRAALEGAIDTLPCPQRVVLQLYYLGGLRLKEIARVLARPVGTVKSRLHYGRQSLRRALVKQGAARQMSWERDGGDQTVAYEGV